MRLQELVPAVELNLGLLIDIYLQQGARAVAYEHLEITDTEFPTFDEWRERLARANKEIVVGMKVVRNNDVYRTITRFSLILDDIAYSAMYGIPSEMSRRPEWVWVLLEELEGITNELIRHQEEPTIRVESRSH